LACGEITLAEGGAVILARLHAAVGAGVPRLALASASLDATMHAQSVPRAVVLAVDELAVHAEVGQLTSALAAELVAATPATTRVHVAIANQTLITTKTTPALTLAHCQRAGQRVAVAVVAETVVDQRAIERRSHDLTDDRAWLEIASVATPRRNAFTHACLLVAVALRDALRTLLQPRQTA
jgi:hypothetical protein